MLILESWLRFAWLNNFCSKYIIENFAFIILSFGRYIEVKYWFSSDNTQFCCIDLSIFKAKGCLPITKKGQCCPSSWNCDRWNRQRLKRKQECFLASPKFPNGKFYQDGEKVPEANGNCNAACLCALGLNNEAEIICAMMDCAFEPIVPGNFSIKVRYIPCYPGWAPLLVRPPEKYAHIMTHTT